MKASVVSCQNNRNRLVEKLELAIRLRLSVGVYGTTLKIEVPMMLRGSITLNARANGYKLALNGAFTNS